jgi:hypothetical protein
VLNSESPLVVFVIVSRRISRPASMVAGGSQADLNEASVAVPEDVSVTASHQPRQR